MFDWLSRLLFGQSPYRFTEEVEIPSIHFARSAYEGLMQCLAPACEARHEGVALLLGRASGAKVMVMQSVRPRARTSRGSFEIPAREMARVVSLAMDLDLQVVGQVHTHPGEAYHSEGDEEGANIRYDGFVSIVIPDHGTALPGRDGWAVYRFSDARGWLALPDAAVAIIEGGSAP
jgi:proteasome lid subunit RPN8/RPN11